MRRTQPGRGALLPELRRTPASTRCRPTASIHPTLSFQRQPYSSEAVEEQERPATRQRSTRATRTPKPQDPYQEEIKQLKLQLKQVKLYLKEINTKMSTTRSQYHETSAFMPEGILHRGYKWFEDMRLLGPQQQKQQLQQQIIQMEQQLLGLEQAQNQWKMQNS